MRRADRARKEDNVHACMQQAWCLACAYKALSVCLKETEAGFSAQEGSSLTSDDAAATSYLLVFDRLFLLSLPCLCLPTLLLPLKQLTFYHTTPYTVHRENDDDAVLRGDSDPPIIAETQKKARQWQRRRASPASPMAPSPPPAWQSVHTQSKGRCLVGSRALQPGTNVLACDADAWALYEDQRGKRCAYCLRSDYDTSLLSCNACKVFSYCSRRCQQQDSPDHMVECAGFVRFGKVPPPTMLMTARLVRRMAVDACKVKDPAKRYLFITLENLVHHIDKAAPARQEELLAIANQICGLVCAPPAPPDMAMVVEQLGGIRFVATLLARIKCNAFTITDGDATVLGLGLFLGAVSANHSCDPNCHQIFEEGPSLRLRALRPVAPGEELTIGYIDISNTRDIRQETLMEGYGFECTCSRCSSLEEQWRETQVLGWACPRRGCLGACVEESEGAALFRAWRATNDGRIKDTNTRARVCTACGERLEVNEVRERLADLEKAEGHGWEFGRLANQRKANTVRAAFAEADEVFDIYACCLIPHISLDRYEFLTRLVEVCVQLEEYGLMVKYGVLSAAGLEAISPRHSPAPAYLYAKLGKALLLYVGEPGQALTYLCKAMRKLEVSHGQEHPYVREVKRLLMDAQGRTGRKM